MRSSIVVLASVIGLAIAQSSECSDYESATDCVLALSEEEASCQTVLAVKKCYDDYCPEVPFPSELNSIVDTCENGGTFPGSGSGSGTGSGTGSETATGTGSASESTSTSGSGSGSGGSGEVTCTDPEAASDCIKPLAKLEQTCDVVLEIGDCFDKYCPERASQIAEDVAACSASGTGSGGSSGSSSGSTRTSSADDSETTDFESGIPGGGSGSTRTTSGADSTGTGLGSGSDENSTIISDPTNTSSNGDGPVSTDSPANEGAADRLFASAGAIIGSLVAVMAWL